MDAVLGRTAKPIVSAPAQVLGVALAVASIVYLIGQKPLFGGKTRPPPQPAACLIAGPQGLRPLDYVDSLENCGVQLEAVYLEDGQPVTGGYSGMRLFADEQGLDAAQLDGPRQKLISASMRRQIDDELRRLMRVREGVTGLQISVVKLGG